MAAWDPFGEARHAARAASLGCDPLDPVSMDLVSWTAVTATKHGKVVGWLHTDPGSKRLGQVLSRGRVGGYGDPKTRGCGGSGGLEMSNFFFGNVSETIEVQARGYSWCHYC